MRAVRAYRSQISFQDEQRVSYDLFRDFCAEHGFAVGGSGQIKPSLLPWAALLRERDGIAVEFPENGWRDTGRKKTVRGMILRKA